MSERELREGYLSKNVWALMLRKKVSANLRISSSPHRMMAAFVLDEYLCDVAWRAGGVRCETRHQSSRERRVVPEAVAESSAQGHHVLQRAAHLHAGHIVNRVDLHSHTHSTHTHAYTAW
jgi:hypothetical protein